MPCFYPLTAYQYKSSDDSNNVVFRPDQCNGPYEEFQVACGGCLGCRIDRSRDWAIRCVHESLCHEHSSFVTLTYNDTELGDRRSLYPKDFQDFIKRLRRHFHGSNKSNITYFHAGEYGQVCKVCGKSKPLCRKSGGHAFSPTIGRPHHHACLFGVDFKDRVLWDTRKGTRLYRSETLEKLWSKLILKKEVSQYDEKLIIKRGRRFYRRLGFCTVGDVNFKSAAYVARYVTKKICGNRAGDHYTVIDRESGEIQECIPEYSTSSLKQGIGKKWFNEGGHRDCFPKDFITNNGAKYRVPPYYLRLLERNDPDLAEEVKEKRRLTAKEKGGRKSLRECRTTEITFKGRMRALNERRYEQNEC